MFAVIRTLFTSTLFLLYPYLVFRGLQAGNVWLAPALIAALFVYQAFHASETRIRHKKLTYALILLLGMVFFQDLTAKLIPIVLQLVLMHFFGKTLVYGPPLIERFVRLEFSEVPLDIVVYCRQLTYLWTGFFGFNALMCLGLALWGNAFWWALFTGVIIFVLTGVLMIGEYIFRHYRFPTLAIPDIKASARNMLVNSRQIWQDVQAS